MGWLSDAAKGAAKNAAQNAAGAASRRLAGTHNKVHNCCGGTGTHLGGCDGKIHEFYRGANHSGEHEFTHKELKQFEANGGKYRGGQRNDHGNYVIHVTKWPVNWKHK